MKLNTKMFKNDIERYIKKTNIKMEKVVDNIAEQLKDNQQDILNQKVKNGTGNLESSITIYKSGKYERDVGPDMNKANYAPYVEYGTRYFQGYHYIRDSIFNVQLKYEKEIKKAL